VLVTGAPGLLAAVADGWPENGWTLHPATEFRYDQGSARAALR